MAQTPPPWIWDALEDDVRARSWQELADWVDWLGEAYSPWVHLPPCWPAHEGLKTELSMFWYWHRWLSTAAVNPIDGVRWHNELRRSAQAWRELATCQHEPPVAHHHQIVAAQRARRDQFLADAQRPEQGEP
ncbi:hypothetical protein AMES_8582 [Amycolatopsis mediterranei S699]|uniref:DUF4913 domain-containing protein n=2 Tax=Amycolatopsis mediterranei TaxID=33910 RepID=A0A0H3DJR8_AMYMU|nr:hypothetical protein [Amycolatopsis mediterranei]ADJ50408.1 hypothetical protein AMED_8713 [Amycolatopsis mediterranei U32]AEK47409.1 hypothetical protein RAM_44710 [Amycolatopsis mediterranei S699]AFO82114.1 hypothetical protein AMES_8582 [Amycolatopsis mediterranei S699]AGT89243.1 hypothetical protein B737_8583 [Amycolatopsis mediterranei RB]KDO08206.1 hypothetical protein DV26_23935 [Amycolatopsis mediterranei]